MGTSGLVREKSYLNVVPQISDEQFVQIFLGKLLGLLRGRNRCFGELKVVEDLHIYYLVKYHDFIPSGLRAMNFRSSLSGLDCMLYRSEVWCFSTMLASKLPFADN
jgi:hypothetical protein